MSGFRACLCRFVCLALILGLAARGEPAMEPAKKGKPADTTLEGDALPRGAVAQFRINESKRIGTFGLAFAPDGRWLMATCESPEICLLDRFTGKVLKSFDAGARASIGRAALSRDGRLLAALVDNGPTPARVHVWDIGSGRELWRRGAEELHLADLCFSPDGGTLALAGLQAIHLWDAATGKEKRVLGGIAKAVRFGGEEDVLGIVFSPDGKLLASGNRGGRVQVWDFASGKSIRVLGPKAGSGTQFAICSLRFSTDGGMLAGGQNSRVIVWETLSWTEICKLGEHDGGVFSLGFSPDGRILATGCWDSAVRLWEVASWKKYTQFKGHSGGVYHTNFSPDGRSVVSGGSDGKVYLWDVFGRAKQGLPERVSAERLEELWKALQGSDGAPAHQAICVLAGTPKQAVPLLKERLKPARVGTAQMERLLVDLNADNFAARTKATSELAKLGRSAQPALRRLLSKPPSEELRRRVTDLLAKLERDPPPPEFLLAVRATAVLEIVGTAVARDILQALAQGAPGALLTEQARASLGRLSRKSGKGGNGS